jgi:hypothetical protein
MYLLQMLVTQEKDQRQRSSIDVDLSIFSTFSSVVDEATTKGLREEAIVNAVVS